MSGHDFCNCCGALVDEYLFEITDGYCLECDKDRAPPMTPAEAVVERDPAQVNIRG